LRFPNETFNMHSMVSVDRLPDPDAKRERLIAQHLPLAKALARRYARHEEPLEDLVQVAALGLVAAARRFDPARGVPFGAFAAPTIEGELRRHLRDRSATIRIPRRQQATASLLWRTSRIASERLGRQASVAEAAEAAGVGLDEALRALAAVAALAPLAQAERRPSADAEDAIEACEQRALLRRVLGSLDAREREVVVLRFVADLSQTEIAGRLHISQSQASRLLAGALEKLRVELTPESNNAAA
jgi:RNA polymerase sigma-B factor